MACSGARRTSNTAERIVNYGLTGLIGDRLGSEARRGRGMCKEDVKKREGEEREGEEGDFCSNQQSPCTGGFKLGMNPLSGP